MSTAHDRSSEDKAPEEKADLRPVPATSADEDLPLLSPDDIQSADSEGPAAPPPVSVPDGAPLGARDMLPQSQEGEGEEVSLLEMLSHEGEPFDDQTEDGLRTDGFDPPSIPGISREITRPRRLSADGRAILPEVVANPDAHTRSPRPDTADPLNDQTVDISLDPRQHGRDDSRPDEPGETVEGAPFDEGTDVTAIPPAPGRTLTAEDGQIVRLEESLGDQRGCVFYRARIEGIEHPFTAVWMAEPRPEPPWKHLPDPRIVRPQARVSFENASVRVFERPKGNTVVDYLTSADRVLPAMATLELGIELAEVLESLHGAGQYVYDLEPSQIVIERGGKVRLYAINGFYPAHVLPSGPVGIFSAPEVRDQIRYRAGAHSDVYAVALMVYTLLARRAPVEPGLDPAFLCSPRVFRPECPLGIWPYLRPCLLPSPIERIGHARGLRDQLIRARNRLLAEVRYADRPKDIVLEAWGELHTGLGKARRGAAQQDRAVSLTDDEGRVGLYLVADGVSRSKYGDGAYASEQVETAALQRWTALEKAGQPALMLSHPQRVDVLRQISRSAGKRISAEVNKVCAPMPNEPNQVMSTTISAAYVAGSEATIANLGDSRSYLIRDRVIERIAIDHDRATDALRMGLSFAEAAQVKMGSALTRVVGRVVIGPDGKSRPDPFEPEIFRVQLMPGDRLLLCSDGIPDFAAGPQATQDTAEQVMLDVILEYADPARAAFELVVLANRGGGYDNISCVVIAVHDANAG